MNTLDLIVVLVVVLSGLFAFVRGFVREALSIVAWIGAGLVAYYGFERFSPIVGRLVPNALAAQLTTVGLLFVVSLLVFSIMVGMLSDMVRTSWMGALDRSLGLVFGLARGVVLVCLGYLIAVLVIEHAWPPKPEGGLPDWMAEARSRGFLERGAGTLVAILPPDFVERSAHAASQAGKTIESTTDKAKDKVNLLNLPFQDQPNQPPPQNQPPAQPQSQPQPQQQSGGGRTAAPVYDQSEQQDLARKIEQTNGGQQ